MELRFFGGEPLLKWKMIEQIIHYGKGKPRRSGANLRFSITTNGTLLNPQIVNFLAEHNCQVCLSIDGPAHVHDLNRRFVNGNPSLSQILKALDLLLEKMNPNDVSVLMTVHHQSLPYLDESIEYIRGLGVQKIGVNPILENGLPDNSPLIFTTDDYLILAKYLKEKYLQFGELNYNPYAPTLRHRYLDRVDLHEKKCVRCGAARDSFAIGVDGSIYACGGFAFEKLFPLGHVTTGIIAEQYSNFIQSCGEVDDSPVCKTCWARYLCGGGCYFQSYVHQRDLRQPWASDCMGSIIMIESALCAKIEHSFQTEASRQPSMK